MHLTYLFFLQVNHTTKHTINQNTFQKMDMLFFILEKNTGDLNLKNLFDI